MAVILWELAGGWALYADHTGRRAEPLRQLDGKATIAAVPDFDSTCGVGCGLVGASGIELAMFYRWNYPALQRDVRTRLLDEWVAGYREWNPEAAGDECQAVKGVMTRLIQRKLEKYPDVLRQIVSCELKLVGGHEEVFVATVDQELPPGGRGFPAN